MADYNNHFELTLDTLAPTGSITRPAEFMKENGNLQINKGDASWMYVWRDGKATGVKADMPSSPETAEETKETNFSTSCQEYYHLVLEDSVGNQSEVYNTEMITFDNVVPVVTDDTTAYLEDTDSGSKEYTNDPVVNFHFVATDNLSGVVSGRIVPVSGSMAAEVAVTPGAGGVFSGTITLAGADGTKQVTFYATDAAGNESVGVTRSIYLDTQLAAPVLTIHNADSAAADISAQPINYGTAADEIKAKITTEEDVKFYKFWKESETEPTGWTAFVPAAAAVSGIVYMYVPTQVTAGDGQKNFYIRVKDQAGTVYPKAGDPATTNYITLDQTKPVVSATRSGAEWISNIEGHKASELTLSASDATAGIKNWTLKCNGSLVDSGNGATVPATKAITSGTAGMVEGSNTFVLEVTDNAENTNSASAIVKLDITIPTASITQLNTWYNAQFSITANTSDTGAGVATIYAWTSMTAADESCPAAAKAIAYSAAAQTIPAADITWQLQQSAANYMHIKVVDAVGNVNFAHCQFGYDNVAPYDNGSKFNKDYYNVLTAQVDLAYGDATSLVSHFKVTGSDIDNPSSDWEAIAATRAVTLNGVDGVKTVGVQFKDNAGNVSAIVNISTELDRSAPAAMINLHVAGEDTAKPSVSNIKTFDAWIAFTDDAIKTETFQYLYYGTGIGVAEADAQWKNFSATAGKKIEGVDAMVLPTSTCTDGDGLKTVYVKFKDGAGNISDAASASFTLDTTAPEPEAKDVDYNRVSKVHVLRRDGAGAGTKYCDEVCFTLDPHCMMQAYRVCAYLFDTEAHAQQAGYSGPSIAEKGSHEDDPIPSGEGSAGSLNMKGTGLHSEATISCLIKGADYQTALGATAADPHEGAHFVVVYVQDEGGNWSVAAKFNA